MKGVCIYCGQTRLIDENELKDAESKEIVEETAAELGIPIEDYIATVGCNCSQGKMFAYKQEQYEAACANVEYILADNENLISLGKNGVKNIINQHVKKVSFAYGNTVIKISRGKEEIKVEKVITTKESLES